MTKFKRAISFFMTLVMLIGMVPAIPVFAADEAAEIPVHICAENLLTREALTPSCETNGSIAYRECSLCGALYSDENLAVLSPEALVIPAVGHSWREWQTLAEATVGIPGSAMRSCAVCGAEETQELPAEEPLPISCSSGPPRATPPYR